MKLLSATPNMAKLFKWLLLNLLLGVALTAALAYDAQRLLNRPLRLHEVQRVTLERGATLQAAIDQLRRVGAFTNPRQWRYLLVYARLDHADSRLKAGDYDVAPGTSGLDLLSLLVQGRSVMSELRIPEGWQFAQALELVRAHSDLAHTLNDALTPAQVMEKLGLPAMAPEGRLFPDTYRFTKGMKDVDFLRHSMRLMSTQLEAEWAARAPDLSYASQDEALIMASIVEKETGAAIERPRIAGVFIHRLKLGMKLQTDPTVIYGMGEAYDGNIRKADLERDTPFNTYTRAGLPPTPICLPSRAAIHAALHPEDDGSLYFVAKGDGSGTHQFSKSLDEHNAAVAHYIFHR